MIKNFRMRITVDKRGHISAGKKREGSDFPQALNYFDCSDFPELVEAYGAEPTSLVVFMPSNNIDDAFNDEKSCWKGFQNGVKLRSCDEEVCVHRVDEIVNGVKYAAGEETGCVCTALPDKITKDNGKEVWNPEKCKYYGELKVYVGIPPRFNVDNTACIRFTTHSKNSGEHIKSELGKIHMLQKGNIFGVPFDLSVNMVPGKDDQKKKYPIWHLQMRGLLSEIRADRMLSEGLQYEDAVIIQESNQLIASTEKFVDTLLNELANIQTKDSLVELDKWLTLRQQDLTVAADRLTEEELAHVREKYRAVKLSITEKEKKP